MMDNQNDILKRINAGIIITDRLGKITAVNCKAEELIGQYYKESTPVNGNPDDLRLLQLSPELLSGNPHFSWNYKFPLSGDNYIDLELTSFPVRDDEDNISCIINFVKKAENITSDESLLETTKNIEIVLYSASSDGRKLFFITDAINKLFGYSPEEVYKNPGTLLRHIKKSDFRNYKKFVRQLKTGKSATSEYEITDKSGKVRYVRHSGFPVFENDRIIKYDGVITEITNEKIFQLELQKSEEKFRFLIETANDLIFTLDSYGCFVDVNSYGALALCYKPEEMKGKHFLEYISDENKAEIAIAFQKILKLDKIIYFEAIFIDKYKKDVVFEIQGRPIKSDGSITGMLGIGRDITERRNNEKKLRELNSKLIEANRIITIEKDRAKQQISVLEEVNKLKSEFIGNISHELRTPLASIVGFSETISLDPEMPKDMIMEFNNIILNESKRLARLINDLLDFAKMESGKIEIFKSEFNIVELLTTILDQQKKFAVEKGLILDYELPETEVIIAADKERIAQVYTYIVLNAIKFTNSGGRIKVIAQDFIKEFEVIISDTGIGIPEKELLNIFSKFFKTDLHNFQSGTGMGIGLGLVKEIIDLHKGLISVKSEVNKGTTFIVKLPKIQSKRMR